MEQGFLLDRVNVLCDYFPVDQAVENAADIFAHGTDSSLPFFNHTVVRTQKTLNLLLIELFIKHRLFHIQIIAGRKAFRIELKENCRPESDQ